MRKYPTSLLILLLMVWGFHPVLAQDPHRTDSLKNLLSSYSKRDSQYMEIAYQISASCVNNDVNQALSMALTAIKIADSLQIQTRKGHFFNQIGNVQRVRGNYSEAIKYYLQALQKFEELGDRQWEAYSHSNLASIYINEGDVDKALVEQEIALKIRKETGNYDRIGGIYNTFGNIYSRKGKLDSAMYYYRIALDSAIAQGDKVWVGMFTGNIGTIHGMKGELKECMQMNRKALAIHKELNLKVDIARDQYNIGFVHQMENRLDSAIYYYRESMNFAQKEGVLRLMQANSKSIKELYTKKGQYKSALYWANRQIAISDSMHSERISSKIKAAETNYLIEKDRREREYLEETRELKSISVLKRQRILTASAAIGAALLLLLAIILYRRNRERKEANQRLEEKVKEKTTELSLTNDQLKAEVKEKHQAQNDLNTYIYRSSHDLKGPLMSMKGLIDVANNDPHPGQYLQMVTTKVDQLDSLLERLIENVEAERRDLIAKPIDWKKIEKYLQDSLKRNHGSQPLSIEFDIGNTTNVVSDSYAIQGILRHILQNAIDFRDLKKENQSCSVKITQEENEWKMEIRDNGIGIPDEIRDKVFDLYYRGNNLSKGNGMGLYLVQRAATRLGGQVSLQIKPSYETIVEVRIPNLLMA